MSGLKIFSNNVKMVNNKIKKNIVKLLQLILTILRWVFFIISYGFILFFMTFLIYYKYGARNVAGIINAFDYIVHDKSVLFGIIVLVIIIRVAFKFLSNGCLSRCEFLDSVIYECDSNNQYMIDENSVLRKKKEKKSFDRGKYTTNFADFARSSNYVERVPF